MATGGAAEQLGITSCVLIDVLDNICNRPDDDTGDYSVESDQVNKISDLNDYETEATDILFHIGEHLRVTPQRGSPVQFAKKGSPGVFINSLLKHGEQCVLRVIDNAEHVIGPLTASLGRIETGEEIRPAGDIEVVVP